jgi:hypothetical protein
MKAQTAKPVTRVTLDYSDDIPGFGTPDPDRVIPAHRRKQGAALMKTQRDDRTPMSFQNAAQSRVRLFAAGHIPKLDGIVEAADCEHASGWRKADSRDRTAMPFEQTG